VIVKIITIYGNCKYRYLGMGDGKEEKKWMVDGKAVVGGR